MSVTVLINPEIPFQTTLLKRTELGKPQKKSSTNGRAIKGGGFKGRAIKEKRTFYETLFFILSPFKYKNYLTLDNLSKYGNITL